MADEPALLARGPWAPRRGRGPLARRALRRRRRRAWSAADAAIAALRDRGSPSHDGLAGAARRPRGSTTAAARSSCSRCAGRCGWSRATRRGRSPRCASPATADGRWLAGRRAPWLSSWAGRWALGAGGAVDVGESPVAHARRASSTRSGRSRPSACAARRSCACPHRLVMFVGQAWLPEGAEVTPDHEHDAYAWWPADDRRLARRGRRAAAAHGRPAGGEPRPSTTLKWLSFTHSAIYLTLLVVWIVPGLHALEFVFGLAHGLGWIAMCVADLAGRARARHPAAPRRRGGGHRRRRTVRRLLRVRARGAPPGDRGLTPTQREGHRAWDEPA